MVVQLTPLSVFLDARLSAKFSPAFQWGESTKRSLSVVAAPQAYQHLPSSGMAAAASAGAWTSPELLDGATASPASDVFAFGAILFSLFVSEPPLAQEIRLLGLPEVLRQVQRRDLRAAFPADFPHVGIRDCAIDCWHRNPARRPDFAEVGRVFSQTVVKLPTSTRRARDSLQRSTKVCFRNQQLVVPHAARLCLFVAAHGTGEGGGACAATPRVREVIAK